MSLSLRSGLFLSVAGTLGKNNEIPISDLVKVLTEFEKVVSSVANAGSHPPVKLSLRGFHAGSAIMELGLSHSEPSSFFYNPQQEEWFENALESVFEVTSTGDYLRLNEIFKEPQVCREVAQSLYGLTAAVGNSPLSLVEPTDQKGQFRHKYAIRVFNKQMLDRFIDQDMKHEIILEPSVAYGVGRIKKTSKRGKVIYKVVDSLINSDVNFGLSIRTLEANGQTFTFFDALSCIVDRNEDGFIIENEELGLVAAGDTMEELKNQFALQFAHTYKRLGKLSDDSLSKRLQRVKKRMNLMIKSIS